MAFAYRSLADGQLPAAKAALYTATGEVSVMSICLVETTGAAKTVNIYLKRSGSSSRRIIPKDLPMDSSSTTKAAQVECLEHPLELSAGDAIEGDASAATSIDYSIVGGTR